MAAAEKVARTGIERDNDMMYYIKDGDVWATPRKKPGMPKGRPQKVASPGIDLDYANYLYFVDSDGDVARKARANCGGGRKPKKAKAPKAPKMNGNGMRANGNGKKAKRGSKKSARSSITGHYVKEATAKRHPGETVLETRSPRLTEEQIARECDEALAATAPTAVAGARKKGYWY